MHSHERPTFLKVFVEVPDPDEEKSTDDLLSSSGSKTKSPLVTRTSSTQSQYCTITITSQSSANDVCNAVARKRNLLYAEDDYELVMCDGDGQASYETILGPQDPPHQFQQSAAKHGHLGDFHFVFRKSNHDGSDLSDDTDNDSEPDIFGTMPQQIKHGKYPAAWMEKRGKNHKAWRRRYFVLIDNELLYYKRRDVYEHKKDPIARIELVNPPGIIKILPPESIRKNGGQTQTMFLFDIHTPKRIYSLRIDNYNDMIFWVKALSKRNEPNELIDGLDTLIQDSEYLHSNDDELIMEKFSNLEIILNDSDSADSYHRYLQSIHNEEFFLFWIDVDKYLNDYINNSKDKQKRFAIELYEKYIKSGGKYELSEIKSEHRRSLRKDFERGLITRHMFNDIKCDIFDYLNRDSYKFFNSNEYFRFIVTYNHRKLNKNNNMNQQYEWPQHFEETIAYNNKEKHKYILSSNQNILHNHSAKYLNSYKNIHSPVLRNRPQTPITLTYVKSSHSNHSNHSNSSHSHKNGSLNSPNDNNNNINGAKSWSGNSNNGSLNGSPINNNNNNKSEPRKYTKRNKKRSFGQSVFDNAPGVK